MKRLNRKGFTLVEIMIVVAIIALLAAIAIPNLLRARLSANDALAQSQLRALSTAAETFGTANSGNYPASIDAMTSATPPYISEHDCGAQASGFDFVCTFTSSAYTITATPVNMGVSGSTTYTMTTGGVLQ